MQRHSKSSVQRQIAHQVSNWRSHLSRHQHPPLRQRNPQKPKQVLLSHSLHCQPFLLRQCCGGLSRSGSIVGAPPTLPLALLPQRRGTICERFEDDQSRSQRDGAHRQRCLLVCLSIRKRHSHFPILSRPDRLLTEGLRGIPNEDADSEGHALTKRPYFPPKPIQVLLQQTRKVSGVVIPPQMIFIFKVRPNNPAIIFSFLFSLIPFIPINY